MICQMIQMSYRSMGLKPRVLGIILPSHKEGIMVVIHLHHHVWGEHRI